MHQGMACAIIAVVVVLVVAAVAAAAAAAHCRYRQHHKAIESHNCICTV